MEVMLLIVTLSINALCLTALILLYKNNKSVREEASGFAPSSATYKVLLKLSDTQQENKIKDIAAGYNDSLSPAYRTGFISKIASANDFVRQRETAGHPQLTNHTKKGNSHYSIYNENDGQYSSKWEFKI